MTVMYLVATSNGFRFEACNSLPLNIISAARDHIFRFISKVACA